MAFDIVSLKCRLQKQAKEHNFNFKNNLGKSLNNEESDKVNLNDNIQKRIQKKGLGV